MHKIGKVRKGSGFGKSVGKEWKDARRMRVNKDDGVRWGRVIRVIGRVVELRVRRGKDW